MGSILWDSVNSLMLTEEAKKSPRLRMNRDMRTQASCPETGHDDASQRMLNALEPGTVVLVHRHPLSTETVCVLRGAVRQSFFEEVSVCVALEGYAKRAQAILDVENMDCSFVTPEAGLPKASESDGAVRERSLKLVEQFVVEAGSSCPMYVVPAGVWHTTEALASGTIIFEAKDGKYGEDGSEGWG